MTGRQVVYSNTARDQVRSLNPHLKPVVKKRIEEIRENPFMGKPLERELLGFYSYRASRFRIIYKIDASAHCVQIYHIGHRKNVYELFREMLPLEK